MKFSLGVFLLSAIGASGLFAASVTSGQQVAASSIAGLPAGSIIASTGPIAVQFPSTGNLFTATLTDEVYLVSATGDLDFLFQLTDTDTTTGTSNKYLGIIYNIGEASFSGFAASGGVAFKPAADSAVPEPLTTSLFGGGLALIGAIRLRRRATR